MKTEKKKLRVEYPVREEFIGDPAVLILLAGRYREALKIIVRNPERAKEIAEIALRAP